MPIPLAAPEVLDREFLGLRAKLIDLAATLDRIHRAPGSVADDPRIAHINQSLKVLPQEASDRAEQLQLIFSLAYRDDWQREFGLGSAS